jgi:hypothetical protein
MGRLWLLAVAACYSPHEQPGAPCDPAQPACPGSQVCVRTGGAGGVGYTCQYPGGGVGSDASVVYKDAATDAAIDAFHPDGPPGDLDGDGVPDSMDNCPTVYNPDQGNEDGDKFGDVCDPCPPVADDNPLDSDGDGVADACDPRPTMPGDKIVLFEGFHHGVPSNWIVVKASGSSGSQPWTAVGDSVKLAASNDMRGSLTIALPVTGHETVSTAVTVSAVNTMYDSSAGVVDVYTHYAGGTAPTYGMYCHVTLWRPRTGPPQPVLVITQLLSQNPFTAPFELNLGTSYVVRMRRDGTQYGCHGETGAKTAETSDTSTIAANPSEIGLRANDTDATFAWVMVVDN